MVFILFCGRFVATCPWILCNLWQLVQMYFEQCIHIFICLINAVTLRLIYISTTLILSQFIPWLYQGRSPSAVCFPTRWCVCRKPCFLWGEGSYVFMLKKCESESGNKKGGFWPEQLVCAVEIIKDSKDTITLVELQMVEIVSLEKKVMNKKYFYNHKSCLRWWEEGEMVAGMWVESWEKGNAEETHGWRKYFPKIKLF